LFFFQHLEFLPGSGVVTLPKPDWGGITTSRVEHEGPIGVPGIEKTAQLQADSDVYLPSLPEVLVTRLFPGLRGDLPAGLNQLSDG
jgi:hypothetical protein